jgi:uncharacterized membrane protein
MVTAAMSNLLQGFDRFDAIAIAVFGVTWIGYHFVSERGASGRRSLNARMNAIRKVWMREMIRRENRIVDTSIMATLQSGTAFFASTSLIAIGGSLALLQSTDTAMRIFGDLPFATPSATEIELKVIGLAVIFVYAFFKFAWSYRLFNYAAILMGAVPRADRAEDIAPAEIAADRAAAMSTAAATHFNRGQRAFFFALAYLGWFLHSFVFIVGTLAALIVMWRRQYASDALNALRSHQDSGSGERQPIGP